MHVEWFWFLHSHFSLTYLLADYSQRKRPRDDGRAADSRRDYEATPSDQESRPVSLVGNGGIMLNVLAWFNNCLFLF